MFTQKVLISGGYGSAGTPMDTVEVFETRTYAWRSGPRLERAFNYASAVSLGSRLLILGGTDERGEYRDEVLVYDPKVGGTLTTYPDHRMREKRSYFVALLIPEKFCSMIGDESLDL